MTGHMGADCRTNKTILHLIDTTGPGGAETVFVQLADLMRERNYRSVVVIRGPGWVQNELRRRGIEPVILNAKGSFNVKFLYSLVVLIKREKVSLIHSHLLGSNVYAAMAGLLARVPVVATYHGMVDVNPNERFRFIKHRAMRWGIGCYVAVSQRLMENIRSQGLLNPLKSTVVYNGIDTAKYARAADAPLRQELNLPDKAILVGSLGNIRRAKAYDLLIKAAASLLETFPDLHFVIAGDQKPSLMAELNPLISTLGVADHIHFLGFQQDCAAVLSQMDLFVLSSTSEGFSISTIEAMATGLPVLVTRCGGPEEIVTHDVDGWMVEPGDPASLADGLKILLEDPLLQERLALAGQQHVRDTFGIERMLDRYQDIYLSLLR